MRRAQIERPKEHPRVKSPPLEGDWRRLEGLLADGIEPSAAARSFGRTLTDFRKQDYFRHQRLLAMSREARADVADMTLAEWAHAPDASDTIRVYWHRYTANAAGRGIERQQIDVQVRPELEDRSASLADVAQVLAESGALKQLGAARSEVADAGEPVAASADDEREAGGVPQP